MSGRYKAVPETTNNRRLVYVVIDTLTGEWMHVYDCFLWAEHKAEEMNDKMCKASGYVGLTKHAEVEDENLERNSNDHD